MGWSQGDLARESRVALNTISRMENGGSCHPASCRSVAEALEVGLESLLAADVPTEPEPESAQALVGLDEVAALLERRVSVNLVLPQGANGRAVGEQLTGPLGLPVVDLENPVTFTRPGLLGEILRALGVSVPLLPQKPHDMPKFGEQVARLGRYARLVVTHCDVFAAVKRREEYEMDFFHALRYYTTTDKKLGLVLVSRRPFGDLLPTDHPLSTLDIKTVELRPTS
ncbi:helix-turn-helix transcriptional regulator [bacterium]|nr:helix-turn-helix transcriptional regulator [bacterium]